MTASDKITEHLSPLGTPYEMRSLSPGSDAKRYSIFEMVKPFPVQAGSAAPAFGEIGTGTQYETPVPIRSLLDRGIIKRIDSSGALPKLGNSGCPQG